MKGLGLDSRLAGEIPSPKTWKRFKFKETFKKQGMAIKIEIQNLPEELRKSGLEERLAEICRRNDIVFMAVFGSFVRGEQNLKSDVDVAIEFDKNARKSLLDLVKVEEELTEIFGRKVDLGIFSSINPYIIDDVKREMRVIYEKG
ncbi:nucleotidyltransferase family protein [Candidatus Bathyarchaeota archaeon]|nr:nucleotidyltransferase family protein [Candidatus Bathyarchaeota archaeon]